MRDSVSVGLDIGSYQVKALVARHDNSTPHKLRVIGTGYAESKGMRRGYIINRREATRSIRQALRQAQESSGVEIESVMVSIGGVGLESVYARGAVVVSRADGRITEADLERSAEVAEESLRGPQINNRKILHAVPQQYTLDRRKVLGDPLGMKGSRLEVEMLYVTCFEQHLNDLIYAIEEAGVDVEDVVASPIAASIVTLTDAQKIAGCILVNIGSETVSLVMYEDSIPIGLEVLPIGSTDITNDIALSLKIPLEKAEHIKIKGVAGTDFSKSEIDEVIQTKLEHIFALIDEYLQKHNKDGMLPAGIILTGGGAGISTIEDLSRAALKLPAKIANVPISTGNKRRVIDSSWSVAYGLSVLGQLNESGGHLLEGSMKRVVKSIGAWISKFLP